MTQSDNVLKACLVFRNNLLCRLLFDVPDRYFLCSCYGQREGSLIITTVYVRINRYIYRLPVR